MFAIYNNVTRRSLIICFSMNFCLLLLLFLLLFFSFRLTNTYLSVEITLLLLLLLQLSLLILPLRVFFRNQVAESSKQGIQAAWSAPIDYVK